ncbi:MAG: twin-arginine translocase subunit TatC [Gemmataceae bacterium]
MAASHSYPDDLFAESRMTFGEHIEDLRTHLLRALKSLFYCMVIGFALDGLGTWLGRPWIGLGRPAMDVITNPVREQLKAFYDRRLDRLVKNRDHGQPQATEITAPQPLKFTIPPEELARIRGTNEIPKEPLTVTMHADPVELYSAARRVQEQVRPPELTTLSVQESMMVYMKVSILCSLIVASPYVFWQIWSFVGAGLYPHERHYVTKYLPLSLGLFLGGIALCEFAVIPQSIGALLWFNDWIGLTPDLRLNEWLSFALLMPLVFGISFQTPLVMLFLERVGIMSVETYNRKWKIAVFSLAVVAAIITPSPDAFTMMLMWLPLCGLYYFGIYLCKLAQRRDTSSVDESDPDELVEV